MRLSEDIKKWRAERPDEWTMDRFYLEALRLEALEEKFSSDNKASDEICSNNICHYCIKNDSINCVECHTEDDNYEFFVGRKLYT